MEKTGVNTVTGAVRASQLGITLMHEHIVFGYPGWEGDRTIAPFDRQAIVDQGKPFLHRISGLVSLKTG